MATSFDEAERRAWAGRATVYRDTFALLCAHTVSHVLDAACVSAGKRLLDVGAGTGTLAAAALARRALVTAIDADQAMVALASAAAPGARCREAALPDLPFPDGEFDSVTANFVLNHVGRPRQAAMELRRVLTDGGHVAVTIWPSTPARGQALLGRAIQAAGVARPRDLPMLAADDNFERTESGLAQLLRSCGFTAVGARTLSWDHVVDRLQWWSAPAAGLASAGQTLIRQTPATIARVKEHYDQLCGEFTGADGRLRLPHAALLAWGRT